MNDKETKVVVVKQENKLESLLKPFLTTKVLLIIVSILFLCVVWLGVGSKFFTDSETTKLGFEDIGELATQAGYTTNISLIDESRTLFGVEIPFTQSKYIYSYDVEIKAGIDFGKIKWSINGKTINVKLPETKILGTPTIKPNSFKVYHEDESIFKQIKLEDQNKAMTKLIEEAEKTALNNGILENAEENAKVLVTGFFAQEYNLDEYEVKFN